MNTERMMALKQLISYSSSMEDIADKLSNFNWDYEGEPVLISAVDIVCILIKYLENEISEEELERWAGLVECRDDLDFDVKHREKLKDIIHQLANPYIFGRISYNKCQIIINRIS